MEVKVNVTIELGPKTMELLAGGLAPKAAPTTKKEVIELLTPSAEENIFKKKQAIEAEAKALRTPKPAAEETEEAEEAPSAPAVETLKKTRKRAPKVEEEDFKDLDEEAQLEAIKAEVTKNTKKGKSADIKQLLNYFDAGRASELEPSDYADFMAMVIKYGAGETVDELLD